MCKFVIDSVEVKGNRIKYKYHFDKDLYFYIRELPFMEIEYSESIEEVPNSICVIPLICDILPIIWILDAELYVPELDKSFYKSIEQFKLGYKKMYPKIKFKGKIFVKTIVDNSYNSTSKSASFFSGGVDALSTVLTHYDEHLDLISLWGSDIDIKSEEAWEKTRKFLSDVAKKLKCKNVFVKTNFRKIVNEGALDRLVRHKANDLWWHGFQHGIAIISHAAPYAYKYHLNHVYIASSFTKGDKVPCASDPSIDNFVKFASCDVIHDGYDFNRQEKVENICKKLDEKNLNNSKIFVRVCLNSKTSGNCCHCEKCYRTIFEIIAEGKNPKDFGFTLDKDFYRRVEYEMKKKIILIHPYHWIRIQKRFFENREKLCDRPEINWIFHYNFKKTNFHPSKHIRAYSKKTINRVKKLLVGGYWNGKAS